MNDPKDLFELELKAKLAVDPAQDLQARIRKCTVDTPEKRTLWLPSILGLGAAALATLLLAVYVQPDKPLPSQPRPRAAENTVVPLPVAIAPVAAPPKVAVQANVAKLPLATETEIDRTPPASELRPDPIEVPALKAIELSKGLAAIPQGSLPFIASIEPIKLEPLGLAARNSGVNE